MLLTLKETTFGEADYSYLEIGGGRYMVYDEKHDNYRISDKRELSTAKRIRVNAPIGGSVKEIRAFAVDRLDSVDFLLIGLLLRAPDEPIWIAGDLVGHAALRVSNLDDDEDLVLLPPLVFRYPKQKPSNMSKKQLMAKIAAETEIKTLDLLRHFGLPTPEPGEQLHLHKLIHRDSYREDQNEQVEEGHNLEIDSCWDMDMDMDMDKDKVKSYLDSCAAANRPPSGGIPNTYVWSMEQLTSWFGNCATGNCSHCQGVSLERLQL